MRFLNFIFLKNLIYKILSKRNHPVLFANKKFNTAARQYLSF